jgi:hypothetical protein
MSEDSFFSGFQKTNPAAVSLWSHGEMQPTHGAVLL